MPIQLLLDWSKALVAIVCSLLLAISFIMCTAKSVNLIEPSSDFHVNRSQLLKRNAIESENRLMPTILSTDAMPLNRSLNHNPIGLDTMKNDTTVVKWHINTTQTTKSAVMIPSQIKNRDSISPTQKVATANYPFDASNELNLDTLSQVDQQPDTFKHLKSLASRTTHTNIKSNGQYAADTTKIRNEQNATQHAINLNKFKSRGKNVAHTTDSTAASFETYVPVMQTTTHQSTITTKASIQSVFLDHLNNFNETKSQNIDSINNNDHLNPNNQDVVDDAEILSRTDRSVHIATNKRKRLHNNESSNVDRLERSANFSLNRATKRIQVLIKGRFIQMLTDGTVNGTQDNDSEYTILQRNTVDVGQIRLIGIATCLYLCMDSCGNLYSSREFTNDCIFNERLEENYNYYTSTHHSSALRTYYVALNRLGVPRKTHLPSNKPLGKLSTYVKAFTLTVPEHRSDAVIGKRFGFNHVKHGIKHLCESGKQLMELTTKQLVYPECNSGGVGSVISSSSSGSSNGSLSKKQQPNQHIRHANTNHTRRLAPASLTDRGSNRKNIIDDTAVVTNIAKGSNCNSEQCPKKKKNNGHRGNNNNNNKKNTKKLNMKNSKSRSNKKVQSTTIRTTTTTTTTTESAMSDNPALDNDNYEDELDYSESVQLPSNGQISVGIASDENYSDSDK
ncbi:serine/threonine-protein kinase DDB_G0283821 [Contarinia nasturtii]|uniref:serine/threonine-protein kinase DDB_G0283821 n=1 Tax=Contarinia nasturtii TaxID=265458 RepID=UPI0012D3E32C|nr:serine/threonine-protein kinase DDB_G0283821 [Contarinia nasturtii]